MEAADMPTIETILRDYGVDDFMDISDLVDALRNRENIMIVDAVEQDNRNRPLAKGDKVEIKYDLEGFNVPSKGSRGEIIMINDNSNEEYRYTVRFDDYAGCLNFKADELRKVI